MQIYTLLDLVHLNSFSLSLFSWFMYFNYGEEAERLQNTTLLQ